MSNDRKSLQNQLDKQRRHLASINERIAALGNLNVPPDLLMERKNTEQAIAQLQATQTAPPTEQFMRNSNPSSNRVKFVIGLVGVIVLGMVGVFVVIQATAETSNTPQPTTVAAIIPAAPNTTNAVSTTATAAPNTDTPQPTTVATTTATVRITTSAVATTATTTIPTRNPATSVKLLNSLSGHSSYVQSVAFSPDGKTLASGSGDTTIKLWDANSGKELRTLIGHSDTVWSVAFSSDGKTVASASGNIISNSDNSIKLWDATSGKLLNTFIGHSSFVSSVAFSPDGKTLASASGDGTIKLWGVGS